MRLLDCFFRWGHNNKQFLQTNSHSTTPIPCNFLIMAMLGGNIYLPVSFGFAIIGTMVMKIVAIIYMMGKIKSTYRKFFSQIIPEIYKNVFRTLRGRFHSECFHLHHGRHKTASPMEILKTIIHTKLLKNQAYPSSKANIVDKCKHVR